MPGMTSPSAEDSEFRFLEVYSIEGRLSLRPRCGGGGALAAPEGVGEEGFVDDDGEEEDDATNAAAAGLS